MPIFDKVILLITLGWRNLWRQKRRSMLVMLTGVIGMMGILLTIALMNGMTKMWVGGAIESGLGHVQVRPPGYEEKRKDSMRFAAPKKVSSPLDKATLATAKHSHRFERSGFVRLGGSLEGVNVMGVDYQREQHISRFDEWIAEGSYLKPATDQDKLYGIIPCLLGRANARNFEVEVGDTVVLSIGAEDGSAASVRARIQGIFESIAEPIDRHIVLVHRSDLSRLFGAGGDELSYSVLVGEHRHLASELRKQVEAVIPPGLSEVLSYQQLQPGITRLIEFMDSAMFVFYAIMLSGFAFVLLNSVLMSVFERTREIGIVRALGSSGYLVFFMILFESILLGLLGSLGGIAISAVIVGILGQTGFSFAAFAKGLEMFGGMGSIMYPALTLKDVMTGLNVAVIMCMLAAIYPAVRAVRLTPIEAIYNR